MKKSSIILKKPIDKGKHSCYNEYKFKGIEQNRCNGRKDEVIMKYFVIATHWDDKRKAQVKYIAGEFSSYMNANIFKEAYNAHYECEIPLLKKVKTLQDGINVMLSDFENNMQEDARNTILVLKNYDGTNLGEFRKNLATYGAVKVRYDGETKGGVETLEIKVNAENYKAIIEIFKKAIIENGMGYDAKDDRLSGNPNQMNIQSMYSDIDLDANDMETELQAAFEEILWFVNAHLANTGQGNFDGEEVNIIFNRDILINESEAKEKEAKRKSKKKGR